MKQKSFTYWKRPWHKWIILGVAFLQIWVLCYQLNNYHALLSAGIVHTPEWTDRALHQQFSCVTSASMAAVFLGTFVIGSLARSKQMAALADSALLLLITIGLALSMFVFRPPLRGVGLLWLLLLVVALACSGYSIGRCRRKKRNQS